MSFLPQREPPHGLARRVDRTLPWAAGASALAAVMLTALSSVPARLPGIALHSTGMFLLERGVGVLSLLLIATTLLGRTLNRELPTGFSATTGSVTYAETVAEATTSSEDAAARLETRLAEQDAELSDLRETVVQLGNSVAEIRAAVLPDLPPTPPDI